jgi:hypothetical protein
MLIFSIHSFIARIKKNKKQFGRISYKQGSGRENELFSNVALLCSSYSAQRSIVVRAAKARV